MRAKAIIFAFRARGGSFPALLRAGLFSLLLAFSAHAWQFNAPPNAVNVTTDRRNNIFFVGENVILKVLGTSAVRYTIRDYYGNIVEAGPLPTHFVSLKDDVGYEFVNSARFLTPAVTVPGWYKLYLHANQNFVPWGDIVGGSMFVIFRNTPGFPAVPPRSTTAGTESLSDNVIRGIVGSGPQRHKMTAYQEPTGSNPNPSAADHQAVVTQTIALRSQDVAQEKTYYTPFDPYRERVLLGAFDNGTPSQALPGVTQIVNTFKNDIKYWEGRNEPNFFMSGSAYAGELLTLRNTIRAADPTAKILGPGTVGIRPWSNELGFIRDFLNSGGGTAIDGVSFHCYNSFLGDPFLARRCMNEFVALLTEFGQQGKERWQTEQGAIAAFYGSFQPRTQSRWLMMMLMIFEQYGIPKEHNHLWYDRSGGFWDVPAWWVNGDGTLFPVSVLLRTWAEELYGTRFAESLDFGPEGNKLYLGSRFTGPGKNVVALMSSGSTDGQVRLQVSAPSVRLVTPLGEERDVFAQNGYVRIPVSEIPTYVRYTGSLTVVPISWGENLARRPGVAIATSGTGAHPVEYNPTIPNSTTKIINGIFENHYYLEDFDLNNKVWVDNTEVTPNVSHFPAWVQFTLPQPASVDRVVIFSGVPYQWDGTLLDYDLQYHDGTQWVTLQTVFEPTKTFSAYTPSCATIVDSFFSDRWVFQHSFPPVTTDKIRIFVRNVTWGGGATYAVREAGGWTGENHINLREVEIYGQTGVDAPNQPPIAVNDSATCTREGVTIRVLANDTDADAWPHPLRIESVSAPANGRAGIVGNNVRYVPNWNFTGTEVFTYTVTDGVKSATATVQVTTHSSSTRTGGLVGFKGEYFSDTTFTNLALTRYDPAIDFDWTLTSPHPSIPSNGYSVRWTGQITPPYSGGYVLSTWSSPVVRLWIDGQPVINEWVGHPLFTHKVNLYLDAGRTYDFRLEFAAAGYTAVIQFLWSHLAQPQTQVIPLAPMEGWRRTVFSPAQLANPAISGPQATPAGDGLSNLTKYALRLSPFTAATNSSAWPQASLFQESGRTYLSLTYRKNAAATDLTYGIGVADRPDVSFWDSAAPPEEILGTDSGTGDPIVRRRIDVTGSASKFIRLEVH
jgi:hypothetical protein